MADSKDLIIQILASQTSILEALSRPEKTERNGPQLIYKSPLLSTHISPTRLVRFRSLSESLSKYNSCPIARTPFYESSIVERIESCGHYFEPDALESWLKEHPRCPVCDVPVIDNLSGHWAPSSSSARRE